jgi:actin related protein 2/3 complex subunit 3
VKGPAPPAKSTDLDIIDEAITFFRANVLFRSFKQEGPADLTLAYLTVFIGQILREFAKQKNKNDAKAKITQVSMDTNFAIPGDKAYCLPGFFAAPASRPEGELFRQYFRQAREELVNRLVDIAYNENGLPNKWFN